MPKAASTVGEYLDALPPDRRTSLEAVRAAILKNLPEGYVEAFNWGMISYEVPLTIAPDTKNGNPLMYAALASQKNHMAIYLCALGILPKAEEVFAAAWTGKKLDMGKSCIRFKSHLDIDLALIGKTIAATSVKDFAFLFRTK
jgi:uncharacterized protein YdhG (YjbR/CyaY superfamily)